MWESRVAAKQEDKSTCELTAAAGEGSREERSIFPAAGRGGLSCSGFTPDPCSSDDIVSKR